MSGHSKWANIKHKKAAADAKRGQIFSKIAKEIMVSARTGGGDPSANITLRSLIQKARSYNMPADNIERAIKKGTGDLEGQAFEEIIYEAYGPGGVAMIVQCLTDNKNRTASEVRHCISKNNGNLGSSGSVAHMFNRKGSILISEEAGTEDELLELVLEAGAEDLKHEGGGFEVVTGPSEFNGVLEALESGGIEIAESEISLVPDLYVPATDLDHAQKLLAFVEALEAMDDVQNVYHNLDIPDDMMAELEAGEG